MHMPTCLSFSFRFGAWLTLILNFFFASVWTTVGIVNSMDYHNRHHYVLPDEWWRIMLLVSLMQTQQEVLITVMSVSWGDGGNDIKN